MESTKSKSFSHYMRALHRDLGFLTFGLVIIYALSGIVLTYRNTDFLKQEITVERQLKPDLAIEDVGKELRLRDFKVIKTEGEIIFFQNGTYNKTNGIAVFTSKEIVFPFNKFIKLHKAVSSDATHWLNIVFGVIFLFLAVSSLWMLKKNSKMFRRGIILVGSGILFTILLLLI
jgi:hypothetical protein